MMGRMMRRISLALLGLCLLGLTGVVLARGQKLMVSAVLQDNGAVKIQASLPDGAPVQGATVSIMASDGKYVASDRTDNAGLCRVEHLVPGEYRVMVVDPLGNTGEAKLVIPGKAKVNVPGPAPAAEAAAPPKAAAGAPIPWGSILGGLGFIFGLSALFSVRRLRAELRRYASRN